ncbi:hypothetical protein [Pseudorhodoferax sp. Leaf267]|uniref:hypothetical protein n=1 Tax=Pseudorhodoferax sp. Leaf267 TaxID=1736316 RepID=UPI0006FC1AE6|nr:hypothetical protein [Pseudorhodoferax sp. Leaf267]KQP23120.1 hypothetical protein ASF43_04345 [Pseudorhodoferax sp. Leaf267]
MPAHVVTGVQLDHLGQVARVRWYLADGVDETVHAGAVPRPVTAESVVDTLEVIDKLLDAEPVVPLFRSPSGARLGAMIKVHVQADGTESIEVDPSLPGQSLRDLPRL